MRVVLFLLKCVVGFFASVGLIVVVLVALGLSAWEDFAEWRAPELVVPEDSILELDLTHGVVERRPDSLIARATAAPSVLLPEAVDALEQAADDERIGGVLVRLGRGDLGLAQAQELREAVKGFRDSGKPAYAFANSVDGGLAAGGASTIHAYLSSAFDQVWVQPAGEFGLLGFHLESPFAGELFEHIGIEARMDQRQIYKGFADRFTGMDMPDEQQENLQRLLDSWLTQVVSGLMEERGHAEEQLRELIDGGPLSAEMAREAGLIHALGYRDEAEAALREAIEGEGEIVPLARYAAERSSNVPADAPRIALVHGLGMVAQGESEGDPMTGRTSMGADTVVPAIEAALDDEGVEAIVLRVSSPGGSYVASDTIWRAVRKAAEADKPMVVSFGDIAASGGYFVAAPANAIVAQPGTVTGSIGVAAGKFVLTGLWDRIGVNFERLKAGEQADFWSANTDFSETQWQRFQGFLDRSYADFEGRVASGRDLEGDALSEAAGGRVWSGADAMDLGLIDHLGGLRDAVAVAQEMAGIDPEVRPRLEPFPRPVDPFRELLRGALDGRVESPAAQSLARLAESLRPLVDLVAILEGRDSGAPELRAPEAVQELGER